MSNYSNIIVGSEYTLEREAIIRLLVSEKDFEIIAQAGSIEEINRLVINQTKADILILDNNISSTHILELMKLIKEKTPGLKVMLLIDNYSEERIIQAICAGCLAYISKNTSASELVKSIRALIRSEVWIERRMMSMVIYKLSDFYIQYLSRRDLH